MQRKHLIVAITAGLGLAGALAYAANRGAIAPIFGTATTHSAVSQSSPATTGGFATAHGSYARIAAKPAPPLTDVDVGDADSFGRNVHWLGVAGNYVMSTSDCAVELADNPDALCTQINDLTANTTFAQNDIARINLPANAANSLLCYWLSKRVAVYFQNPGTAPVLGRYSFNPTVTVENPLLNDPGLINPITGAPFGGRLTASISASEGAQEVVHPGLPVHHNLRDSAVCESGLISKRQLVATYGLTAAQATSFFANPMTLRLNVSGSTRYAQNALYSYGLRIVGD